MEDSKRSFKDQTDVRRTIFIKNHKNLLQLAQEEEELHNRLVEVLVQNNFMKRPNR